MGETEDNISIGLFGFFVCHCYSSRTHYSTLEKLDAQNIVCENQGKQRKFSDH